MPVVALDLRSQPQPQPQPQQSMIARTGLAATLAFAAACSGAATPQGGRMGAGPAAGETTEAGTAGDKEPPDFGGGPVAGSPPPASDAGPRIAPVGDRKETAVDMCPGPLSADVADQLKASTADASGRWLYPYQKTVYPRGLPGPVLQWENDASASAALIHLKSMLFEAYVCVALSGGANAVIPQEVWETATEQSRGNGDPLMINVTLSSGSSTTKLPPLSMTIALASLKGAIYYNTYGSLLATSMGVIGGVVMRVLPGEAEPSVFLTAPNPVLSCIGCHAVSADGSRMVAELHVQPGLLEGPSSSYDLSAVGTGTNPPPLIETLSRAGFSGIYPDGSFYMTTGRAFPGPFGGLGSVTNVTGTFGPEDTKVVDMATGNTMTVAGLPKYALMPMFSVDGTMVAFNRQEDDGTGGRTLAVADFDRGSMALSNTRDVFSDPAKFPGWPFFLPDVVDEESEFGNNGKRLVFALGDQADFVTQEAPVALTDHRSDLYWLDVESGMATPLERAGGFENGVNYMPFGEADAHRDFIPTVSPVAAGGYFWVFFTTRRNYGNLYQPVNPLGPEAKKIWVSAIDINAAPGTDPSHPAFFLPGQELESGNIRAFAALEPCRENGNPCESGLDCCCGFCREDVCACAESCANIDEKCDTAADCCDPSTRCIGGFCSFVVD